MVENKSLIASLAEHSASNARAIIEPPLCVRLKAKRYVKLLLHRLNLFAACGELETNKDFLIQLLG